MIENTERLPPRGGNCSVLSTLFGRSLLNDLSPSRFSVLTSPTCPLTRRLRSSVALLAISVVLVGMAACRGRPASPWVDPMSRALYSENGERPSESALATLLFCADSLGRIEVPRIRQRTCTPCLPLSATVSSAAAAAHARLLWERRGRAPHDSLERSVACAQLAWNLAIDSKPDADPALIAEATLVDMASVHANVRARALARFDSALQVGLTRGDTLKVSDALGRFALGMWERAQLLLARPESGIESVERAARDLSLDVRAMRVLPPIPDRSREFGVSESVWSARLFTTVAQLTPMPARSRWTRLALSPWVTMAQWVALDSATSAALLRTPDDSGALPARALAAYWRMRRPVLEQDRVHALFDSVLRTIPRTDSARIDGFDHVLSRDDDAWREGFLPSDRLTIETRGWLLLDPLWSTPVNEIRLARRARVLEADYRYADIAAPGESGSQTAPGWILLRRGRPTLRWQYGRQRQLEYGARLQTVRGGWRGLEHIPGIEVTTEMWKAFYSALLQPKFVANALTPLNTPGCQSDPPRLTVAECAARQPADWSGVPFASGLDTIDVTVARFRAGHDSVDVHVGARLPLRTFLFQNNATARDTRTIRWGLIIADAIGNPLARREEERPLPNSRMREWLGQWTARVASGEALHRVEALEPTLPSGARGAMLFTSDSSVAIPLRGFGMSDLLVAANARERATRARRWTDFDLTPNAGVVMPRQPFVVLWEIYDLTPGPDGRVRWKVEIRRELGARVDETDMRQALVETRTANRKVVPDEPDASSLDYNREGPAGEVVAEMVKIPLPDNATWGRHVVAITVTDLVSGKRVTRSTGVRMLPPQAQRRTSR